MEKEWGAPARQREKGRERGDREKSGITTSGSGSVIGVHVMEGERAAC